jgi:hypothetical protein
MKQLTPHTKIYALYISGNPAYCYEIINVTDDFATAHDGTVFYRYYDKTIQFKNMNNILDEVYSYVIIEPDDTDTLLGKYEVMRMRKKLMKMSLVKLSDDQIRSIYNIVYEGKRD